MEADRRNGTESEATVFLISDSRLVRDGLVRLLQNKGKIRIVGARPALGLTWQDVAATRCQIVLAHCTSLNDASGLLDHLSSNIPESPLVIFGIHEDLELFLKLVSLKVSGYALEDASADELIGLITELARSNFAPGQAAEHTDSESLVTHGPVHAVPPGNFLSDC
jgi:DNA-binding NarL/FixJ family response regulator